MLGRILAPATTGQEGDQRGDALDRKDLASSWGIWHFSFSASNERDVLSSTTLSLHYESRSSIVQWGKSLGWGEKQSTQKRSRVTDATA